MTAELWIIVAAFLVVFWFWAADRIRVRKLRVEVDTLKRARALVESDRDSQGAMYRAAYRDLLGDYSRLHAAYKRLGGRDD